MEGSKRIRLLTLTMSIGVLAGASGTSQSGRPSATALEVTAYRAIGAKHPDPAIRNADVLAERLLGADERAILKETGSEAVLAALAMDTDRAWASLGSRSVFARGVHVRTRHIDEVLMDSLKAGSTQIVILGAGLDSRAYRFGDALRGARVFELDLPQTQEYKKARVRDVLGSLPTHVTYAPIDFTRQDLAGVLTASEQALRNLPPALREVSKSVASVGEPFVFGMPGDNARAFVTARGYSVLSDFGSADLGVRFLPKGNNMPTPSANRLCVAVVR